MGDIRRLERETQLILQKKLGKAGPADEEEEEAVDTVSLFELKLKECSNSCHPALNG